jgi:predicted DNA binding CopG/RHH family protein
MKMSDIKLDAEEKELLSSYEADEWQSVSNLKEKAQTYSEYASATFKKDRRVTLEFQVKI